MRKFITYLLVVFSGVAVTCRAQGQISVAGTWYFRMDTADRGIIEKWYLQYPLNKETILLPGSMPQRDKGFTPTLIHNGRQAYTTVPGISIREWQYSGSLTA